jgi:DNA-binding MarR family transcriptional regulator
MSESEDIFMKDNEKNDLLMNLWAAFPYIFKLIRQGWPNRNDYDLSIYHYEIIGKLLSRENLSMSEIGHLLGIQKSNITPLVNKLVKVGLVSRYIDHNDRRIIRITLTDQGRHYVQRGKEMAKQNLELEFAGFSQEDLSRLSGSFKEINSLLNAVDKEGLV